MGILNILGSIALAVKPISAFPELVKTILERNKGKKECSKDDCLIDDDQECKNEEVFYGG